MAKAELTTSGRLLIKMNSTGPRTLPWLNASHRFPAGVFTMYHSLVRTFDDLSRKLQTTCLQVHQYHISGACTVSAYAELRQMPLQDQDKKCQHVCFRPGISSNCPKLSEVLLSMNDLVRIHVGCLAAKLSLLSVTSDYHAQ